MILPHTDPTGRIVSLYGRRIDGADDHKHHHLPGRAKGALNAQACNGSEVWITEGPFDAVALMAAGIRNAVAVFGVQGIRWNWLKGARRIVLAFDTDEAGRRAILEHGRQALMRGAEVLAVMPDELGGAKDIAEAWAAGTLRLEGIAVSERNEPQTRLQALVAALPDEPPASLDPVMWADYRGQCNRFVLEHAEALAIGWTEAELFALPPSPGRPWNGGALWTFAADEITEVTNELMRATSRAGNSHTLQRCNIEAETLGPLPWE